MCEQDRTDAQCCCRRSEDRRGYSKKALHSKISGVKEVSDVGLILQAEHLNDSTVAWVWTGVDFTPVRCHSRPVSSSKSDYLTYAHDARTSPSARTLPPNRYKERRHSGCEMLILPRCCSWASSQVHSPMLLHLLPLLIALSDCLISHTKTSLHVLHDTVSPS